MRQDARERKQNASEEYAGVLARNQNELNFSLGALTAQLHNLHFQMLAQRSLRTKREREREKEGREGSFDII
jgi:hypothetical protein